MFSLLGLQCEVIVMPLPASCHSGERVSAEDLWDIAPPLAPLGEEQLSDSQPLEGRNFSPLLPILSPLVCMELLTRALIHSPWAPRELTVS